MGSVYGIIKQKQQQQCKQLKELCMRYAHHYTLNMFSIHLVMYWASIMILFRFHLVRLCVRAFFPNSLGCSVSCKCHFMYLPSVSVCVWRT